MSPSPISLGTDLPVLGTQTKAKDRGKEKEGDGRRDERHRRGGAEEAAGGTLRSLEILESVPFGDYLLRGGWGGGMGPGLACFAATIEI